MSKLKLYSLMLLVGFICLALDINVNTGFSYPHAYKNSSDVTGEYQYNNIASNYNASCTYKLLDDTASAESDVAADMYTGAVVIDKIFFENWQVDIFNDFLGFLLIAIACLGFGKSHPRFRLSAFAAFLGFVLHGIIVALPFFCNGLTLCNTVFVVGMAYEGSFALLAFLVASGLFFLCPDISCRDERKWGKLLWFGIAVLHILITVIFWIGTDYRMLQGLGNFFVFVEVCLIIWFALILKRTSEKIKENFIA